MSLHAEPFLCPFPSLPLFLFYLSRPLLLTLFVYLLCVHMCHSVQVELRSDVDVLGVGSLLPSCRSRVQTQLVSLGHRHLYPQRFG